MEDGEQTQQREEQKVGKEYFSFSRKCRVRNRSRNMCRKVSRRSNGCCLPLQFSVLP